MAAAPDTSAIAARARETGRFCIDTEFMGEGRYRPLLCLVQVAVENHAGESDVFILDPQVAAGFAGMRAQLGYEALLNELLDVKLNKSASFTKWDQRPLSEEQVGYAKEDVLHPLQATDALKGRLNEMGRLQWAVEE